MRSSHKNHPSPIHFEELEVRVLLSASVAQVYSPHYVLNQPNDSETVAEISGVVVQQYSFADIHAIITWDNGQQTIGEFGQNPDGTLTVAADFPGETLGSHTAHVDFWQTDASAPSGRSNELSFNVTAVVDENSANGTTIHAGVGQEFSGYVGTLANLSLPGNPQGPISGPFYGTTDPSAPATMMINVGISWGDGTSGTATLVANPKGGYDVYGDHTYASAGSYRIEIDGFARPAYNPDYTGPGVGVALPDFVLSLGRVESTADVENGLRAQPADDTHSSAKNNAAVVVVPPLLRPSLQPFQSSDSSDDASDLLKHSKFNFKQQKLVAVTASVIAANTMPSQF